MYRNVADWIHQAENSDK